MIKVIVKNVGEPAFVKEIENTLEAYREIIDGYIELVPYLYTPNSQVVMLCNEDGIMLKLEENALGLRGNFIVCRAGMEEFESLTDSEIDEVLNRLNA
jgi:hypothetical protein